MGGILKLESKPEIRGIAPDITISESNYFFRINTLLRKSYIDNMYSDQNLNYSLLFKSFTDNPILPKHIIDISWLDYIKNYIEDKLQYSWANELLTYINEQSFMFESKYDSIFFYNEFLIKTIPESLTDKEDIDNDANIIEVDKIRKTFNPKKINNADELDVTANLGGSYLDLDADELLDELKVKFAKLRKPIKKYVKIFKNHIYKNNEHPIMCIISKFNNSFCTYINNNLTNYENQLKKNEISLEEYNNNLARFETEITTNLQNFIEHMHCTLKLFYSTVIDYNVFKDYEEDDLINMITTIFFKTGNLYETLYKLYSLSFSKDIQELQDRLINLKNVKPKNLDVQDKFCLDENTLELQENILKKKSEEKDNKEEGEKARITNKPKLSKKNSSTELNLIKEFDEEKEEDDDNGNDIKNKQQEIERNESGYMLVKIDILEDNKEENDNYNSPIFSNNRNTLNFFSNKKIMFPKLHNKLRDSIAIKDEHINEAKSKGYLQMPYLKAIKLFTTLKKYKAPFEKIVILAAVFDQIMENVISFWSEMKKYIKEDFLYMEPDERIVVFMFIIIQSQMPEIFIFNKMFTNFTTKQTKAFKISTFFAVVEASLDYIFKKDMDELDKDDMKQLKDARKTLAEMVNQRLSVLG